MSESDRQADGAHGIGAVARLTGLSDHTIRAWERRYGAVVARRAANGRRVYTEGDIEKLALLATLTERGEAIGQVAALDTAALRARLAGLDAAASDGGLQAVRVAVLGDFLPAQLAGAGGTEPLEFVVADSSRERVLADLARQRIDVIVVESAVLGTETVAELRELLTAHELRAVLVYGFGRSADVELARDLGIVVLRAPVSVEELRAAVLRTPERRSRRGARRPGPSAQEQEAWPDDGEVPARRFSQRQLAGLRNAASPVDCECPQHLAQLVADLGAFELYSAGCENRNEEDAALHRYLHVTTARARALIEEALARVAEAEGLDYR